MADPRAENCKAFKVDSNSKVVGVELGITPVTGSIYEVYSVRLRDEYEAGGQTIAACSVLDKNGINTGIQVRLTWPGKEPPFDGSGLPGNPTNTHVITNSYNPPKLGPLALHVGEFNAPVSDIVYGLGLPFSRHISFDVVFRERGGVTPPPTGDLDERVTVLEIDVTDLNQRVGAQEGRVANLQAWARAVSAANPGGPQYG
ncbi:MAG: hypothetical protein KDE19_00445 [Caldilineaceae bacterium]|nr:hypothetical protein [Caldilineaceae bacterium]